VAVMVHSSEPSGSRKARASCVELHLDPSSLSFQRQRAGASECSAGPRMLSVIIPKNGFSVAANRWAREQRRKPPARRGACR